MRYAIPIVVLIFGVLWYTGSILDVTRYLPPGIVDCPATEKVPAESRLRATEAADCGVP